MSKVKSDAFLFALNLLGRRPYFSFELEKKLSEKGFDSEEISKVIKKLTNSLLLNDEERFKALIEYYQNSKKFGLERIKFELLKKGVQREILDEMLDRYYSKEVSERIKDELILKKKEELKDEEKYKAKQKIYAYLRRRGF
jgi:regulatory protein